MSQDIQIPLREIIPIDNRNEFKIHLASWNGKNHPLDEYVRSWDEWVGWNRWRSKKDDFNRHFIFSLIEYYHEPEVWLFGGVFRVLSRTKKDDSESYEVELVQSTSSFIGRLKVRFKRPARARSVLMEKYYDAIFVSELLKEKYTGENFCGYENINHDFLTLENIYRIAKPDWKAALENIKGVYLITDKSNGKRYVGSAYGESGIWSRWSCYINTGHGYNDELTTLIRNEGISYARENFTIALLEYRPMRADDKFIIERENYWKEVLLTRGEFGYNKN